MARAAVGTAPYPLHPPRNAPHPGTRRARHRTHAAVGHARHLMRAEPAPATNTVEPGRAGFALRQISVRHVLQFTQRPPEILNGTETLSPASFKPHCTKRSVRSTNTA